MSKVWIELPKVDNVVDAQVNCEFVNRMLNKLGCEGEYFWASDNQKYCNTFYNVNDSGAPDAGFTEAEDRGKWFNLEYLAK